MKLLIVALLCALSYAQTDTSDFLRSDVGACPQDHWSYINDEGMCETAAIWAGFEEISYVIEENDQPRGCFIKDNEIWFNADYTFTSMKDTANSLCRVKPSLTDCYTEGIDFGGSSLDAIKDVKSPSQCQELCEWDWFCVSWTWRKGDAALDPHTCILITGGAVMTEKEDKDVISGPRQCPIKTACDMCSGQNPEPISAEDIVYNQNAGESYIMDDVDDFRLALAFSAAEFYAMTVEIEPNFDSADLDRFDDRVYTRSTSYLFIEAVMPHVKRNSRHEWTVNTEYAEWISEDRIGQKFYIGKKGKGGNNPVLYGYAMWEFTEDQYVINIAPHYYTGYQKVEEFFCWGTDWYCSETGRSYMHELGWKIPRPDHEEFECWMQTKGNCYGFALQEDSISQICAWSPHLNYCMEIKNPKIDLDVVVDDKAEEACGKKALGNCFGGVVFGKSEEPMICAWLPTSSELRLSHSQCRAVNAKHLEEKYEKNAKNAPKEIKAISSYCQLIEYEKSCNSYRDCSWGKSSCNLAQNKLTKPNDRVIATNSHFATALFGISIAVILLMGCILRLRQFHKQRIEKYESPLTLDAI